MNVIRIILAAMVAIALASVLVFDTRIDLVSKVSSMEPDVLPNNLPHPNPGGKAATFSTQGQVNLTGEYFQAQGSNGRSCASCHIPEEAWSINPGTLQIIAVVIVFFYPQIALWLPKAIGW